MLSLLKSNTPDFKQGQLRYAAAPAINNMKYILKMPHSAMHGMISERIMFNTERSAEALWTTWRLFTPLSL